MLRVAIAIVWIGITAVGANAFADEPTVCGPVFRLSSQNPKTTDFMRALQRAYPSCAQWLANSCLSSHRLDPESEISDSLSNRSSPSRSESCKPSSSDPLGRQGRTNLSSLASCLAGAHDRNPPTSYQSTVARKALDDWELVNEKRAADLETIFRFLDREKAPKKISNDEIRSAIRTLTVRVEAAAQHAGTQEKKDYERFVADQIADAAENDVTHWTDSKGIPHTDIDPGIYARLEQEKSDSDRFNLLATRARQIDTGDEEDFDGNLTPYHSKMILLYFLENAIQAKNAPHPEKAEKILNDLASQLHLKADYTERGATQWNRVIPHDGFVLGASMSQIHELLNGNGIPAEQRGVGTGIDCATFAQQVLIRSGYVSAAKGRLTSAAVYDGALKGISNAERMTPKSAAMLGPGDLIVERPKHDPVGHVQIVVGYEGNPPQLVVVSAEGGYQRGIIKRRIDLFPNQPKDCGEKNYFAEEDDNYYYRVKLTRGPR